MRNKKSNWENSSKMLYQGLISSFLWEIHEIFLLNFSDWWET